MTGTGRLAGRRRNGAPVEDLVGAAEGRLRSRLLGLMPDVLGLSDYSLVYLKGYLGRGAPRLSIQSDILRRAIDGQASQLETRTLVDFGGGNGLLALLAREVGIGTVIYTDIDPTSAADAKTLGAALDLQADAYVAGDMDALLESLRRERRSCDLFCSNDVIEHVYDVHAHLRALAELTDGPLRVVMASEANGANPRIRRRTVALQRLVETRERGARAGQKSRDSLSAYVTLRQRIIRERTPAISEPQAEELARRTRGMNRPDIERAAERFAAGRGMPPLPDHPTNTCDPLTGNWAEHLMDPFALARELRGLGFRSHVAAGRYSRFRGVKGLVARALNALIGATGRHGLRLAPYYLLVATRGRPAVPRGPAAPEASRVT